MLWKQQENLENSVLITLGNTLFPIYIDPDNLEANQ